MSKASLRKARGELNPKDSIQEAFASLKAKWWWFNRELNAEHGERSEAWAWEILRRTLAYREFHNAASAVHAPPAPTKPASGTTPARAVALIFGPHNAYRLEIAALATDSPLGELDPRRHWPELFLTTDKCAPDLSWPELSDESRRKIPFGLDFFPGQNEPVKKFRLDVAGATVERLGTGDEQILTFGVDGNLSSKAASDEIYRRLLLKPVKSVGGILLGKHPASGILPENVNRLAYVVIAFDTRAGEAALSQLDEWKKTVFGSENDGDREALEKNYPLWWRKYWNELDTSSEQCVRKRSRSKVVPTKEQYRVQAWIPLFDRDVAFKEIRMSFRTLIGARERKHWMAQCKSAWAMPESIEIRGQCRMVTYGTYQEPPTQLKTKSGRLAKHIYRCGLPAFDVRERGVEYRFAKHGLLFPFLLGSRSSLTSSLLRDYFKVISRSIERIDQVYARHPAK